MSGLSPVLLPLLCLGGESFLTDRGDEIAAGGSVGGLIILARGLASATDVLAAAAADVGAAPASSWRASRWWYLMLFHTASGRKRPSFPWVTPTCSKSLSTDELKQRDVRYQENINHLLRKQTYNYEINQETTKKILILNLGEKTGRTTLWRDKI